MSLLIDIADAVTTELNGADFGRPFTAVRRYVPLFELSEMDVLHVTVVPRGTDAELVDRARVQQDYQIDVGVQQRIDPDKPEEVDPLLTLVQQIGDHFTGMQISEPRATCIRVENRPVYDPEHLSRLRQLTSVLTLTFRTARRPSR